MGQQITPLAPQGSRFDMLNPDLPDRLDWLASQAATSVVSPDRKTMLVLTSGSTASTHSASRRRRTHGTRRTRTSMCSSTTFPGRRRSRRK